ncbi:MAG: hypothetical protein EOO41_02950, partial [Methanobacteriota archaeon]
MHREELSVAMIEQLAQLMQMQVVVSLFQHGSLEFEDAIRRCNALYRQDAAHCSDSTVVHFAMHLPMPETSSAQHSPVPRTVLSAMHSTASLAPASPTPSTPLSPAASVSSAAPHIVSSAATAAAAGAAGVDSHPTGSPAGSMASYDATGEPGAQQLFVHLFGPDKFGQGGVVLHSEADIIEYLEHAPWLRNSTSSSHHTDWSPRVSSTMSAASAQLHTQPSIGPGVDSPAVTRDPYSDGASTPSTGTGGSTGMVGAPLTLPSGGTMQDAYVRLSSRRAHERSAASITTSRMLGTSRTTTQDVGPRSLSMSPTMTSDTGFSRPGLNTRLSGASSTGGATTSPFELRTLTQHTHFSDATTTSTATMTRADSGHAFHLTDTDVPRDVALAVRPAPIRATVLAHDAAPLLPSTEGGVPHVAAAGEPLQELRWSNPAPSPSHLSRSFSMQRAHPHTPMAGGAAAAAAAATSTSTVSDESLHTLHASTALPAAARAWRPLAHDIASSSEHDVALSSIPQGLLPPLVPTTVVMSDRISSASDVRLNPLAAVSTSPSGSTNAAFDG